VENFWKNAIVSYSYADLKAKLAERRKRGPNKAPLKTPTTIPTCWRACGRWARTGDAGKRRHAQVHSA
jgi:hypothetical protein